jgi:aerobic carbon-monoxide dehydrogenase medium subunit
MKPAAFDYHAPCTLEEAVGLLAALDNAKVLAGGQSLVPMMNFRYVIVDHLVDLAQVEGLRGITVAGGALRIGAMTSQRELEFSPEVAQHCPLLGEALGHIGHRQTRNRGTIGGSLVHADPAAELPAVCAAHDAEIEIASTRGVRAVPFRDFTAGFMATIVQPDEIVTAIRLPLWPAGHVHGFREFARRRGDFAIAGAAVLLDAGPDARVRRAAIALCGIASSPIRLCEAEALLTAGKLDAAAIKSGAALARAIEPLSDIHAGADYRRHLAEVMTRRALAAAAGRAGISL